MQRSTKIILIVVAVVLGLGLLGGITCVAVSVLWVSNNADRFGEEGTRAMAEGEAAGRSSTAEGCVDQALERTDRCGAFDPLCQAGISMFLRSCMAVAQPSPTLCEGVPSPFDVMRSGNWAMLFCERHGRPQNQACISTASEIQVHCHPPAGLVPPGQPGSTGAGAPPAAPPPAAP